MTWLRLSDTFPEDPRWEVAGAEAMALHVAAMAYCSRNLTDGVIPRTRALRLLAMDDPQAVITALVKTGFWVEDADTYQLVDYLTDQWTRERIETRRAMKKARQDKWLDRAREKRDASHDATPDASRDLPPSHAHTHPIKDGYGRGAPTPLADARGASPQPNPSKPRRMTFTMPDVAKTPRPSKARPSGGAADGGVSA